MEFSNLNNNEFWKNVRECDDYQFLREELAALYKKNCTGELSLLTYSDYCIFFETGSRKEYEEGYFLRRRRLDILAVLCKIYPDNETYFKQLENTIWAVLDEYSWALPAHVPDKNSYVPEFIDLFAAETGYCLSEMKSMFSGRLSPLMVSRITFELDRRIIKSFYAGRYWWESFPNNWAAVCAGSVGITFLYERPELFYAVKPRIDGAMKTFLSSYKSDGVCREGLGYWNYGFGYFCYYAAHLRTFSDGTDNLLALPQVKTIAKFQQQMFLKGSVTVSFADGSDNSSYILGLTHFLKTEFGDDFIIPKKVNHSILDTCGRWGAFSFSFLFYNKKFISGESAGSCLFADSAWFTMRNKTYAFAAKGGTNDEPHNHNDLGSFILADESGQLVCDLGCGEYTRQYFEPDTRYSILCNSSLGHGVPIIGGEAQREGAEFFAALCKTENGICIDLTHAYQTDAIKHIKRRFGFSKNAVTLNDEFSFYRPVPVTERFVSRIKPEIKGNTVQIGNLRITAETGTPTVITQRHLEHGGGGSATVYLIDFALPPQTGFMFQAEFAFSY